MLISKTEFGDFYSQSNATLHDLYLSYSGNNFLIGWFDFTEHASADVDMLTAERLMFDKLVLIYVRILRFEIKYGMFSNLPLKNEFKDAVLRNQIEATGQTLDIRKYAENKPTTYLWKVYSEMAGNYDVGTLRGIKPFVFRCPYGMYTCDSLDVKHYSVSLNRDGWPKDLATVLIPYDQLDTEKLLAAYMQMVDVVGNDVSDQITLKTGNVYKRTADLLKYILGYDNLRMAIKNRAILK